MQVQTPNRMLFAPKASDALAILRIAFGLVVAYSTARFIALDWVNLHFINTKVTFSYYGFGWVKPLVPTVMHALHYLLLVASVFLALGFLFRVSAIVVFLLFTYFHTIDVTYYLNHYYFVSLIAFWFIWVPAGKVFSADNAWLKRPDWASVPAFSINIFKFQIAVLYFFAGIAKINSDWLLNAMPLKIWLPSKNYLPIIGPFFEFEATAYLFSYFGMLFDVFIIFFLINKRTVYYAWVVVAIFHALTGMLFQIGIFYLVMPLVTLVFFPDNWHKNVIDWLKRIFNYNRPIVPTLLKTSKWVSSVIMGYVVIQLLVPFRYLFYPNNLFWTEEGYRFSWRVMLMEKSGTATFYLYHPITGHRNTVINSRFLNPHQEKQMAMQPDLIVQFAHYLADYYQPYFGVRPIVKADVYATLNGRPSRLLIDPSANLAEINDGFLPKKYILPLPE